MTSVLINEIYDWVLMLVRWTHITVGITWIGTSIFFMWLDRSLVSSSANQNEGHMGELWMVHGGGFYKVEKMLMGPTKVPSLLHWFKWEAYWTWMTGVALLILVFYTDNAGLLIDEYVREISFGTAIIVGLFTVLGSWLYYDFLWERKLTRNNPIIGHVLTLIWFVFMSYGLCHVFAGRGAYIHVGAMLGTWMAGNVFLRIIPRQVKMVEASKNGEPVNQDWAKNAKSRSTHNTYFTLPIIFIMLSNHFPNTYGHPLNWLILIFICTTGACIREFFIVRLTSPSRSKLFLALGFASILISVILTRTQVS